MTVSADSHVVEVDDAWKDVDKPFLDVRPRYFYCQSNGSWMFKSLDIGRVPIGLFASAGRDLVDINTDNVFRFDCAAMT